jgi:ATP-dependent RNA helicase SUPV3L1/SUV3
LLSPALLAGLGWPAETAEALLRGLDYQPGRKPEPDGATLWRRRGGSKPKPAPPPAHSPFAALAGLAVAPPRRPRRKPRKRRAATS